MKLFGVQDVGAICDTLVSLRLTRDDMMETLSETVFPGDEKSVLLDSKLKAAVTREMNKRVDTRKTATTIGTEDEDPVDSEDDAEWTY